MNGRSIDELGELQRAVVEAVWQLGEATVRQVLEHLNRSRSLAYTTALSSMQKLEAAGWLEHRREGRTYVYRATRSRAEAGMQSLRRLAGKVFGGDPLLLFQHLMRDQHLSSEDLAELKRMIEEREEEMDGGGA